MTSVLPMVAVEARRQYERDVSRSEVALSAHERCRHLPSFGGVDLGPQCKRVLASVVVVDPGGDAGDMTDDRIHLDRMQSAARRTGALDAHNVEHRPSIP